MIHDDDVEKALDYLRNNARKAAQARAERIYLDEYTKSVMSNQMKEHLDLPVSAQEREARASQEFKTHLEALKVAIEADEFNRWGMVAAQATLDAWRTQQANKRSENIL